MVLSELVKDEKCQDSVMNVSFNNIAKEKPGHWSDCAMYHNNTAHSGSGITLNEIRCLGFWVICGNWVVKSAIFKCITCRKLRGRVGEQMIADLPKERFEEAPIALHLPIALLICLDHSLWESRKTIWNVVGQCLLALLAELSILRLHTISILTHSSKHWEN